MFYQQTISHNSRVWNISHGSMSNKDDYKCPIANDAHHENDEEHQRNNVGLRSIFIRSVTVGRLVVLAAFLGRKIGGRQYAAGRHVDNHAGQTHCVVGTKILCETRSV